MNGWENELAPGLDFDVLLGEMDGQLCDFFTVPSLGGSPIKTLGVSADAHSERDGKQVPHICESLLGFTG